MTTTTTATTIDTARPREYEEIGRLLVAAYARLPGMPGADEQPDYYRMLGDVAARARNPALTVYAARADDDGRVVGSVDFIADMAAYGATDAVRGLDDAAGVRLLAVDDAWRGRGIGARLTRFCIERARDRGRRRVVLHTTRAMQAAWALYARLGFRRLPAIDFRQGALEVYGFALPIAACAASP